MTISSPGFRQHISLATDQLLSADETLLIVDDDRALREPLRVYFSEQGLNTEVASNAEEMFRVLGKRRVALILLDIGLPDADGVSVIPQILDQFVDVAVVMLTGVADLHVALECIRKGADDYLSKPVQFSEIFFAVRKALEKRRLLFENRRYQEELEKAHFRTQVLHRLSNQMNTVYLSTVELEEILQGILVGITANEGLQFNRAFLALFNRDGSYLEGRLAIGPNCREEAARIWGEMQERALSFHEIVDSVSDCCVERDLAVNEIIRSLKVPASYEEHVLIKAVHIRQSIMVQGGKAPDCLVPGELIELLGEGNFVVVPLYSPGRSLGVIIADNFITQELISERHISELEIFASQASLAIEQSHLYMDMQKKIAELEELTEELDKKKDLLVAAEKYSALGQMAAQMVHTIRNPITSIGGVARILSRKAQESEWSKYCTVIIKETERIETTLEDLFNFVSQSETHKKVQALFPVINKALLLMKTDMVKHGITWEVECPDQELRFAMDIDQIHQMLVHLLKNAIESMPDGGELRIVARATDEWVRIRIYDTGVGLAEDQHEKAKAPFFTTKTYGTGMGLTMVERVIKAHNGEFFLQDREGGGTGVLINLARY